MAVAQPRGKTISGTVVDDAQNPLVGVTVVVEGKKANAITNVHGRYEITASRGDVLVFNYLGMHPQKIAVTNQTVVDVQMVTNMVGVDEIVVVGYGVQNRRDITTAISSVSPDKLQDMPLFDINQAMIGQAAGVNVISASGAPGGGTDIQIRGLSTLSADTSPLYVVDGVVLQLGSSLEEGPFSFINPADVASIEILKDAAAAAIYGSRASNGVVLITTKNGEKGQARVRIAIKTGVQEVFNKVDLLSAQEFATLAIEARNNLWVDTGHSITDPDVLRNSNTKIGYFQDFLDSGKKGTDWQDAIYQLAPYQEYQVNVNGGSETVKYMVSGGIMDQEGIVKNSDFQRYSFRTNVDFKLGRRFDLSVKMSPIYTRQNYLRTHGRYHDAAGGIVQAALLMNPLMDIYDPTTLSGYSTGIAQSNAMTSMENPVAKINLLKDKREAFRFLGDVALNYNILPGLNFKLSGSANVNSYHANNITPSTIGAYNELPPKQNAIQSTARRTINLQSSAQLSYRKQFSGGHDLNVVGVFETQFEKMHEVIARASDTWTDDMIIVDSSLAEDYRLGQSNLVEWGLMSGVGRINYNFRSKYYLMASLRADGSSRFAKKWGIFPAASAAWRISQEPFMRNIRWISDLKLRASYGVTGNNAIGNYQHLRLLTGQSYTLGAAGEMAVNGVRLSTVGNDDLTWEQTNQIDAGIDLSLFRRRLNITVDYYNKKTKDLLLSLQIPYTSGFTSRMSNMGKVRNEGWEFTLQSQNLNGRFKWDSNFNISFNKQTVLALGPTKDPLYGDASYFANTNITQVGQPVGLFYGMKAIGVYKNQEEVDMYPGIKTGNAISRPGELIYEDVNKDGRITIDDRTILGDPHPDFTFGFTNNFSYRNFTLKVFLRGSVGAEVMNMAWGSTPYRMIANGPTTWLNRWQSPENPGDGKTPRVKLTNRGIIDFEQLDSTFIEDGSFLNIQNVSLSYRVPAKITKKLRLQNLVFTLAVNNAYMWTKYTGYNPEGRMNIGSTLAPGVDWGTYPLSRTYMFTLATNF
ncbi:MAG: TonB-dependent receptor [Alistipes sp.]|nr:TonB-dependent receptor [Alistipes sp.]